MPNLKLENELSPKQYKDLLNILKTPTSLFASLSIFSGVHMLCDGTKTPNTALPS
ncbi:MAG: hypothetical protein UR27_C0005G0013 [Candidatus Peregrinibacteria bacterium GW2011_GWA2_33_10]|nr:MAG: hypothetical protein UR27_C0005G0013 [Candidatus Peregrinibacteria bacterium GW2011_GWA2_33_10]KKP39271.1 MAG: hypothetical protein UR30_C0011G0014 [Candidatus Peregrinibacteria bacterium GW2011_GWC2_33_13]